MYTLSYKKMIGIVIFLITVACNAEGPKNLPDLILAPYQVNEGNKSQSIFIPIELSNEVTFTVTATFSTQADIAIEGDDFIKLSEYQVVFRPGETTKYVPVIINGEREVESDETLFLQLISVKNAEASEDQLTVTLLNDDSDIIDLSQGNDSPLTYEGMTLIWADEFEGTDLNLENWSYEIGGSGWGNNESQYYTDKNTTVKSGALTIEARKEPTNGKDYSSSRIKTAGKFEFTYGRVDMRAKLPYGQGIWPALWMLGANISDVGWPKCGEIDMMEKIGGVGNENTVHGTLHWDTGSGHKYEGSSTTTEVDALKSKFHVFSIIWDENTIQWLLDDVKFYEQSINQPDKTEFHAPYFIIFNLAVGGNWPGYPDGTTEFPQQMVVDYIRVFQPSN